MDVTRVASISTSSLLIPYNDLQNSKPSRGYKFFPSFSGGELLTAKTFCRGRSSLMRRDNRSGNSSWSGAIHVASLKKDGPVGEGSKPRPENNGTPISSEVKYARSADINEPGISNGNSSPLVTPVTQNSNGSRPGLFRTPISGGVQSATSSHGLPHPAVAVRNLIEQARFAHLCTIMSRMHHRRRGYPFGSLVDFATDNCGHPIFSLSPLAIHTRNLLADPRCTLVVQIPGWSGLANARVTLFGDVYPLPDEQQERAHQYFRAKHQQGASQQWSNFTFYRMENISDIYFVGGFGTVAWVDVKEYDMARPDIIAAHGAEKTLQELNLRFSKKLRELLASEAEVDDAALISIDSKGVDIRVRQGAQFNVRRISFEEVNAVETLDQAMKALQKILDRGVWFIH